MVYRYTNIIKSVRDMDIITRSFVNKFKAEYGYYDISESDVFELFSIYCVLSKYDMSETINKALLDELKIGKGNDWGIDGFVAIVNGKTITTIQEVEDLLSANNYLEVTFVFVQAKTSISLSSAELGQFIDGMEYVLRDVLGETALPDCNEDLLHFREIVKFIYSHSADFKNGRNPELYMYYVACGNYNAQPDFTSKISKAKQFADGTNLVSDYNCYLLGKNDIVGLYKDTKIHKEIKIKVDQKLSLPEVDGIAESYLCLIPFGEFRKTFIGEDDKIISSVFYDNIRSYQGDNLVNHDMSASLKNNDLNLFTAMNNGITVIVKSLQPTGAYMILSDYQIVNGCQTCNVLHQNMSLPNIANMMLTVKIVSSTDKNIRDKIIVGNNSQTEIKREQLVSLLDTQ